MARRRTEDDLDPESNRDGVQAAALPPGGVPGEIRLAALVLDLQAVGLVVVTAVLLIKTVSGDPNSVGRAVLAAAFAVGGALLLVLAGRSFRQLRPLLRTPIVVVELLALPIGWSLGFQAGRVGYAAPLLIGAAAELYLLFTPAGRRALQRQF